MNLNQYIKRIVLLNKAEKNKNFRTLEYLILFSKYCLILLFTLVIFEGQEIEIITFNDSLDIIILDSLEYIN